MSGLLNSLHGPSSLAKASMDRKKRVRSGHRASATRTARQIEEALTQDPPDRARLTVLTHTLKEKLETLKNLDTEIADQIEDETAMIDEIEQADDFKQTLYPALLQANKLLQTTPEATSTPTSATTPTAKVSTVRLPKLQLRHYNGDLSN